MSTATITTEPKEIGKQIREAHNKANGTARKALEHAAECGRLLIQAKKKVGHGYWATYLQENCGEMSTKTATNYMRLASNWQRVADFGGSMRDTIKLLTMLDNPPKAKVEDTPQPDPAPPFKAKPIAPVTVEAELVEPVTAPAGEPEVPEVDEPAPLIVDGIKDRPVPAPPASHIPEQEPVVADGTKESDTEESEKPKQPSKWNPDDAGRLWTLARTDLDKILKSDRSRERVLREVIEYGQTRLGHKRPVAEVETIIAMISHLTKGELEKLKRAIHKRAIQLVNETLTGKAIEQ